MIDLRRCLPVALLLPSLGLLGACANVERGAATPPPPAATAVAPTPAPADVPAPAPKASPDAAPARAAAAPTARAPTVAAAPMPRAPQEREFVAPAPIDFKDAVRRAGAQLLADASALLGPESRVVVIDPLIDANTGAQTVSTVSMGTQLEGLVEARAAAWKVQPLTRQTLASRPLLLIGTLTPVTVERSIDAVPDAFRVWLTLIDLRTGTVVAKSLDRATPASVDPTPLKYYSDSPTWHKDKTVAGYINSCQVNTRIGDPADPDYLAHLPAAAVVNEATMAYEGGKLAQANQLYREASKLADPGDLRVLNGLYLTSWQLGQRDAARDAFDRLVASGLEEEKLPLKLLFRPGGTTFHAIGDLPQQYDMWIKSLAQVTGRVPVCVRVVGHTSRTGSARVNERLSRQRAETVAAMLTQQNRAVAARLSVAGVGSREALVGIGTDDLRDALDRRVEFRVVDCV